MESIIDAIYVEGNILLTCINCLVLFIAFDCLLGFASLIKNIKGAIS